MKSSHDRAPAISVTLPKRSRSANAPSTTGRSGAKPTPPATMIRSCPAASANPQLVPNGPRMPITVPGCASCNARLTAPTEWIVWVIVSSVTVGTPLTEIAISPIPNAYIIMNSPGRGAGSGSPIGSSCSVEECRFSAVRLPTRYGTGVIADGAGAGHVAVSVIALLRQAGKDVHLFGDVDSGGAPGDTPSATHASGAAELIMPGAELAGDPVPVSRRPPIGGRCPRART